MDYKKKKKELEEKFEKIKQELVILEQNKNQRTQELLRLQGEYRFLLELEKEK